MRLAWRASLAKIDLNREKSGTRDGAGAALIAVSVGLALIALYPIPGWAGYTLPKAAAKAIITCTECGNQYREDGADTLTPLKEVQQK